MQAQTPHPQALGGKLGPLANSQVNSQGPVFAPAPVFHPPLFLKLIEAPLNNHSTSFLSSHISPHTPATHNRRLISWGPRVQPPRPLHSHPGMPTPSCEHLQLSLCSLQVPWIDACGPAWPSQCCRGLPRARSHRAQHSAGRRVLLARSSAAAGPAAWAQVWTPPQPICTPPSSVWVL